MAPASLALLVAIAGCGRAVSVTPPTPDAATVAQCTAAVQALPEEIAAGRSWVVDPPSPLVRAWGSPPVVLRCGVAAPAALTPSSQLVAINGIDWFPEPLTTGTRFTTVAAPRIEVSVPEAYLPASEALVEISAELSATSN